MLESLNVFEMECVGDGCGGFVEGRAYLDGGWESNTLLGVGSAGADIRRCSRWDGETLNMTGYGSGARREWVVIEGSSSDGMMVEILRTL